MPTITRRAAVAAIAGLVPTLALAAGRTQRFALAESRLAEIERGLGGGRLGVAIRDTANGTTVAYHANERFPLCSTFKFLLVAAVLRRVAHGREGLERRVAYDARDIDLAYAPVTKAHRGRGMTIGGLCAAAIEWSDNGAANLLLRTVGGPAGLTRFARSIGDHLTRLDRIEPALNTALPDDPRDTTTPAAMVADLGWLLLESGLPRAERNQLATWMRRCQTGGKRLRAGLPGSWQIGDKTGTGEHGTANDVAIIWPPGRKPLLAAVYITGATVPDERCDAAHEAIGRLIAEMFDR